MRAQTILSGLVALSLLGFAGCGEGDSDDGLYTGDSGGGLSGTESSASGASGEAGSASADGGPTGGSDGAGTDSGASEATGTDATGSDSASTGDGDGGDGGDGPLLDIGGGETTATGESGGGGGDGCQNIDLLFIVDISASMSEEKANLATNFPNFVQVMDDYVADPESGASAYRFGTTNSSIVNNNAGQSTMGLDGALFDGNGGFFSDCDNGGAKWIDGPGADVVEDFSCYAGNPKSGCSSCSDIGKERPLDTIKYFIEKAGPGGVNDGFYGGDESLLVVVILTDEDDDTSESLTGSAEAKALLDDFAGGEERYVVVSIAGPQAGGCDSAFGSATAAPVLHEFTGMVPNGVMGDICLGDLSTPLADALSVITESCDELPPPID
jgi:hypothetical protein